MSAGTRVRGNDRGSAAVEVVLVTPLLMIVLLVVVGLGRLVDVRLSVVDAAHQAARAASLARTEATAHADARRATQSALGTVNGACAKPHVTLTTDALTPGASTSARVVCTVAMADLVFAGFPGAIAVQASADSPIDVFRSAP
ncbi:TadE/TadG family type IV pilus assembly protein [Streptomyces sp. NPDC050095]|uniref:TadE/TadG family type IV pilus assembly protein n=1 Tax=unclassified Streptomyces TaxID=2593676 RepID=UPI00344344AA